ncbi:MAG: hypothetical protein A2169_15280 [Deltaproteobacteria bacterium RBG_13_47_9]|nr:MAG: hypothetical protein A2169_15280 [Deltaproteobacteria bacterium RBG_13_47_9]
MKKYVLMTIGCFFLIGAALNLETAAQTAPKTIKVSAVISLTGPMAGQGTQLRNAYEIFVEKMNATGGVNVKQYGKKIPLEMRVLDDESDGVKTQSQLEVANSWGAVANWGGLGCSSFEMGTPIAQKNKMVWVGPGCGGWTPHQQDNKWLFSTFHKTPFFCPLVFDMILKMPEPRPNKVAIFEINQLDCQEADQYWREAATKGGFKIVFHQKYSAGTKDFSAMITGAKAAGAEILLAYPTPPEGLGLVKQMKELDFNPKLTYLVRAPESAEFGPSLGSLADYVVTPVAWSNKLRLAGNDYLVSKFKEKYGKMADPVAGSAFAAGEVLVNAMERSGTLDRTAIRDAVKATDMETVAGHIRFSDQGWAIDKVLFILQWMRGDTHIVYKNKPGEKYGDKIPLTALKWQPKWSER